MIKFMSVDYASKEGDYTCIICWHKGRKGTIIVNNIECIKRKEVRKKMAIDYKEEWDKFKVYYGGRGVALKIDEAKKGRPVNLGALMDRWIDDVIESREGLMQEYVRVGVETEIVGGEAAYHTVKIIVYGHTRGCVSISKDAFRDWLKNRMKGGK